MHFDIMASEGMKETTIIYRYGKEYFKAKGQEGRLLRSKECRFCYIETVKPQCKEAIEKKACYIYEIENSN